LPLPFCFSLLLPLVRLCCCYFPCSTSSAGVTAAARSLAGWQLNAMRADQSNLLHYLTLFISHFNFLKNDNDVSIFCPTRYFSSLYLPSLYYNRTCYMYFPSFPSFAQCTYLSTPSLISKLCLCIGVFFAKREPSSMHQYSLCFSSSLLLPILLLLFLHSLLVSIIRIIINNLSFSLNGICIGSSNFARMG